MIQRTAILEYAASLFARADRKYRLRANPVDCWHQNKAIIKINAIPDRKNQNGIKNIQK
jgi:hypothetical protein